MAVPSYWSSILGSRLSRRRSLAAAGGVAVGAAFFAACGGSDDKGGKSSEPASSLVAKKADTTKTAKPGGVLKLSRNGDTTTGFDPHNFGAPFASLNELLYSRLLNIKPGYLQESNGDVEGDLAESWEFSPDKLTLTLKLRRNAAFHNIDPVNGRMVDANDVAFSWKHEVAVGQSRATVANSISPAAPVISITATDASTVVVKLKEPVVYILDLLTRRQILGILPREAEDKFDTKQKAIGSGAVYLSDYKPSVGFTFKRHEGYYDQQKAFAAQADYPIITEYAQAYAQFRAGNLHYYEFMRGEDVLPTKRDLQQLSLYQDAVFTDGWRTMFGQLPTPDGKKSPFLDERVRQAYSMAINRDLWIDVIFATEDFQKGGLPVERRWNTALQANAFEGWWLDPRGKDFGDNAKYYQHNLAEAKKLLAAAGYPNGMQLNSYISSTGFGPDDVKLIQVIEGFAAEAGFAITPKLIDYNRDYVPNYRDSEGQFSGIGYKSGPAPPASEASARLINDFYSKSATTRYGYDVKGVGDNSGDPFVDQKLEAAKVEFDDNKRKAIVYELQKYLAQKQYAIRSPGGASKFTLVWPAVQNYGVFNSDQPTRLLNKTWWLDQTQAPFKS